MKHIIAITVVLMSTAAFAQSDAMTCTNLTMLNQTVCRITLAGKTTYTLSESDAAHSIIRVIPESEYDAAVQADTEATAAFATQLHADNVRKDAIARYGKRYYVKALACEQDGGKWSDMRHSCKAAR